MKHKNVKSRNGQHIKTSRRY